LHASMLCANSRMLLFALCVCVFARFCCAFVCLSFPLFLGKMSFCPLAAPHFYFGAVEKIFSPSDTKKIHLILSSLCANNTENKNDTERQPQSESAGGFFFFFFFFCSPSLSFLPSSFFASRERRRERERWIRREMNALLLLL